MQSSPHPTSRVAHLALAVASAAVFSDGVMSELTGPRPAAAGSLWQAVVDFQIFGLEWWQIVGAVLFAYVIYKAAQVATGDH